MKREIIDEIDKCVGRNIRCCYAGSVFPPDYLGTLLSFCCSNRLCCKKLHVMGLHLISYISKLHLYVLHIICAWNRNGTKGQEYLFLTLHIPSQPALMGPIAHSQTPPVSVCHVQQTPSQVELLLQIVPVLQDSLELLKRIKALAALVSQTLLILQSSH